MFGHLADLNICRVHQGKYAWVDLAVPNRTHKGSEQEAEDNQYVSVGEGGRGNEDRKKGGGGLGRSKGEQTGNWEVNHRTGDFRGRDATSTL